MADKKRPRALPIKSPEKRPAHPTDGQVNWLKQGALDLLAAGKTVVEVREMILGKLAPVERRIVEMTAYGWRAEHISWKTGLDGQLAEVIKIQEAYKPEINALCAIQSSAMMDGMISDAKQAMARKLIQNLDKIDECLTDDNKQVVMRALEFMANRVGLPATQQQDIHVQTQTEYLMSANVRLVLEAITTGKAPVVLDAAPPEDDGGDDVNT